MARERANTASYSACPHGDIACKSACGMGAAAVRGLQNPLTMLLPLDSVRCGWLLAAGLLGLALVPAASRSSAATAVSVIDLPVSSPNEQVTRTVATETAPASTELLFALDVDGDEYLQLGDDLPERYGTLRLIKEDGEYDAIADVAARDLPAEQRAWLGRAMRVDGRCTAHVSGFAVIARVATDSEGTWTAERTFEQGARFLALRLDGCSGEYAREAALPDPLLPVKVDDAALAARARAALLASEPALDAQREWSHSGARGDWRDNRSSEITADVYRHPTTGALWVAVHAHVGHGCGDPGVNVWGLYRVEADGRLAPRVVRTLETLETIDQLIDVDGDGTWELLGKPWLELDRVFTHDDGEEIERLSLPYDGCPC
jgi:hypothetical protein